VGADQSAGARSEVFRELDELYQAADRLKGELDQTAAGQDADGLAREAEDHANTSFRIGQPGLGSSFTILAADAYINAERYADAVEILESRRSQLMTVPGFAAADKRDWSVALLTREALAVARLGDFAKLSQVCGAGIADVELDRYKVSAPHMEDTYLKDRINLYRVGIFAEWRLYADTPAEAESVRRKHIETMLGRAELSKAHSGLGWLSWPESDDISGQHSAGSHDVDSQPPSAVDPADAQLSLPAARARFDELTKDSGDKPVAAARRRAIWDEIMAAQSRARRPAAAWPVFQLPAVQSALDQDEAVLYYYWLNDQILLVFGLDRDIARVARVPLDLAARNRLDRLVSQSLQTPQDGFAAEFAAVTAQLLPAELSPLLDGKRRLLLSPHRVLHQLPLQAMPWNGEPLCAKLAVTIIPNLTGMLLRHQSAGRALLAVGVAHSPGQLEALPRAPADAREIAGLYRAAGRQATVLVDPEATRDRLAELASGDLAGSGTRPACLHFATHGTSMLSQTPMEASLALADGPADGLDIARWSLAADLVVLAACASGQQAIWDRDDAGELIGDEMLGLPAAFLAAGAHQVVGTLWRVRDDVAHRMTIRLHQELLADQPAEMALYRAALAEREIGGDIADWGAFQLIAVGRTQTTSGAAR
jgi:CHAT domain-containing protein